MSEPSPFDLYTLCAVVGSRSWPTDYETFCQLLVPGLPVNALIVTGGDHDESGKADNLIDGWAVRFAREKKIPYMIFPADWDTHGKAAGPIRNSAIANVVQKVFAFHHADSRGTADVLKKAKARRLHVVVFTVDENAVRKIKRRRFKPSNL